MLQLPGTGTEELNCNLFETTGFAGIVLSPVCGLRDKIELSFHPNHITIVHINTPGPC